MNKKRLDEIGRNFVVMNNHTLRGYIRELLDRIDELESEIERLKNRCDTDCPQDLVLTDLPRIKYRETD